MAVLSLGACVTGPTRIAGDAVSLNQDVASTEKRFILLNILRAAAGEPAFFASLSNIDSRSRGDLLLAGEVPVSFDADDLAFLPGLNIEDSAPRYTLSTLNSANFTRVMSRPMDLGVFERLLSRRYDRELLLTLMIGEIGWGTQPLVNDPDLAGPSAVRRRIRLLAALGLGTEPLLGDNTLFEDMEQDDVLELIEEQGIASSRLSIVPDRQTGGFDVIGEPGGFRLCFRRPPVLDIARLNEQQSARVIDLTCRSWVVSQLGRANLGGRDLKKLSRPQKRRLLESIPEQIEEGRRLLEAIDETERVVGDEVSLTDLLDGLIAQSESGEDDGVGEQELGRLENFGAFAISMRSPIEVMDFVAGLSRPDLALRGVADRRATRPDTAYRGDAARCWTQQTASDCGARTVFHLREGEAFDAVPYRGRDWHVLNRLDDPQDQSSEVLAVIAFMQALATQADELDDVPRVTVLP
ncbi:hypothetical protein K3175_05580 [Qipengyuania sp. GH1]|uniref:hypothetical protein n=1 Tax=Qipengyuania aestuarii TaxID=2867241 RepID=UPI001C88A0C5|nr:hypothetical protein [Qipengyuania aestuarii]MBX7535123.1 hypothetical protein [Qipengyuania aestuarii]